MATLTKKLTLIFADAVENHNKVWYGELYDNGDVITRWGRVGYDLQSKDFPGMGESFLLKKEKEKLKKGYTPAKVVDGTVGSTSGTVVQNSQLHEIAKKQLVKSNSDTALSNLVDRLVRSNIHRITSSTNITFSDTTGLFSTPLGIVTPDAVSEARDLLVEIMPFIKSDNHSNGKAQRLVSDYLRLVPQDIGMKFNVQNILPDMDAIQKQNDILDSLEASYSAISTAKPTTKSKTAAAEEVFKVDLKTVNGSNDAERLNRWYESSKKSMHGYDRVKVRNVFSVKIHGMDSAFLHSDRNLREVFHGTSEANCLSILKSGLKVSPPSSAAIAGKMFGNGIYGAIQSSKSLGYTYGKWGQGGVGGSGWLFICQFAMGKCYETKTYGCSKPSGYDSIWAKASAGGLYNDELIVYTNNRVNITYLLECK